MADEDGTRPDLPPSARLADERAAPGRRLGNLSIRTDVGAHSSSDHQCMTSSRPTLVLCLATGMLAVPVLVYAAFVAVETASYIPFPGEDTSRHRFAYLFSALLGSAAVVALGLTAIGVRVARSSRTRQTSTAIAATALSAAALAGGLVGVTILQ